MTEDAATPTWSRKVGWRQGHVVPAEALMALGIAHDADTLVMVVSHDCDLANDDLDAEPYVEVIIGRTLAAADPSLTRTKSPRTLHLELNCDGRAACVELVATQKHFIPKSTLATYRPDARYHLDPKGLETLRHWLAVRYARAAFPDEFVNRLRRVTKLADRLEKIVKKPEVDRAVSAVYFHLDTLEERDPEDPRPYELTVVLVYEPDADPLRSGDLAADTAERIRTEFRARCLVNEAADTWRHIRLVDVLALSEEEITVSQAKALQQWRLEHISLKSGTESADPFDPHS